MKFMVFGVLKVVSGMKSIARTQLRKNNKMASSSNNDKSSLPSPIPLYSTIPMTPMTHDQGCFIKAPAFRKGLYRLFETLPKRLN